MRTIPAPSIEIPVDRLGPPGVKGELHVLTMMVNEQRRNEERFQDQTERQFKVYCQLSKNPPATENIKGDFGSDDGSSYLALPDQAVMNCVRCAEGMFEIKKNNLGEMSLVKFECVATNPTEAKRKFQTAVLPFLDYLSFLANCPVVVAMLRVEDPENNRISMEYVSPYRKTTVNPHIANLFLELAPVYAMYREAKNSYSDFYKFLCYYKILEGLLGKFRANIFIRARAANIDLGRPKETVPAFSEIPSTYQKHIGMPVKAFFDSVLTPQFRNAVAHFISDDGAVLNTSLPEHIDSYGEVLYVLELCVLTVIKSHETFLNQLHGSRGA
ncbi:MAG: methylamine utilization protein MauJ [Chlorobiaceae bacterium]